MNPDGEKPWPRQLLVAVAALLAVALIIAGVVSAFALGAAKVSGIDDASDKTTAEPSLVVPDETPSAAATPSRRPSDPTPEAPKKRPAITLRAEQTAVQAGERINLSGDYPSGNGALLQVQRLQGGWTDFPVTTSVDGGRFSTYIQTSRTGDARFRVIDKGAGRTSNVVRVTIG